MYLRSSVCLHGDHCHFYQPDCVMHFPVGTINMNDWLNDGLVGCLINCLTDLMLKRELWIKTLTLTLFSPQVCRWLMWDNNFWSWSRIEWERWSRQAKNSLQRNPSGHCQCTFVCLVFGHWQPQLVILCLYNVFTDKIKKKKENVSTFSLIHSPLWLVFVQSKVVVYWDVFFFFFFWHSSEMHKSEP